MTDRTNKRSDIPTMGLKKFGVIFDMDGTIIDNMPYHIQAFKAFSERHNIRMGDEEFLEKINGKTNEDIFQPQSSQRIFARFAKGILSTI